ncbi:MAG: alanine racemase [Alphaproteobacteria bacterium]|nr:alanine racemase [Alphaproteobacteria bacterium]
MASTPASPTSPGSRSVTSDPRRTGALLTIDLAAIAANYRYLAERVAPAECAAVVKADAYGLGADIVAAVLAAAGARTFFVAHLQEGLALRRRLPQARIGIFNGFAADCGEDYVAAALLPVLNHPGEIADWVTLCRQHQKVLPAFLHLDTGMNRLGLTPSELIDLAADPAPFKSIDVQAILSHLACADEGSNPMTAAQAATFRNALARLPRRPASLANSAGIFRGRAYHLDMVRPGIALYGGNPTPEAANPMRHTVRLSSHVIQLRHVDSPQTVGYGATHRFRGKAKIATIPVGYADGYLRALSNRGKVWIAGGPARIVGRVSMDLITVDVSHLADDAAAPGTPVDLIGPQLPVDEVARDAGTVGYEILTGLGPRYARRYVGGDGDPC